MSALHVPLGWHARGDHAEVELDGALAAMLDRVLEIAGNTGIHLSPAKARALAADLVHYAIEATA